MSTTLEKVVDVDSLSKLPLLLIGSIQILAQSVSLSLYHT